MSSGVLKALRLIWLIGFICLFVFVGREQQKVFLEVTQKKTSVDFRELYHQSHLIAARPVVSIPYLTLVLSALIFLFGPDRQQLRTRNGKLFLAALSFSCVVYLYLLLGVG